MNRKSKIWHFFLPEMTRRQIVRIAVLIVVSVVLFSFVLIPFRISGHSMAPTYRNGGFNFCFRFMYLFSKPSRGDVVAIRFAGKNVMLLKRVVATAGEVVAFEKGRLVVDGEVINEPYVRYRSDWQLSPREVKKNYVYVVGDNRGVPIEQHDFGQTSYDRIMGGPLW